jgi:hypothetical protein
MYVSAAGLNSRSQGARGAIDREEVTVSRAVETSLRMRFSVPDR